MPLAASCTDEQTQNICESHGMICLNLGRMNTSLNIRNDVAQFGKVTQIKIFSVSYLIRTYGYSVIVSDVDVVWLNSPIHLIRGTLPQYRSFASADLISSTDCASIEDDRRDNGCFTTLVDRNTGVLFFRNTSNSLKVLSEWYIRTGMLERFETDQTAFDDLIRGRLRGHRRKVTAEDRSRHLTYKKQWCGYSENKKEYETMGEPIQKSSEMRKTFRVCIPNITRDLNFGIFPLDFIANGHTYFVQRTFERTGITPLAIHATYQYGDTSTYAYGKRERFRQTGLWLVDPPQHEAEKYLVVENDVHAPVPVAWNASFFTIHKKAQQHVNYLNQVRRKLAHAVVTAMHHNLTIVVPPIYCFCDKFWSRLTQCTIGASVARTLKFPFICPVDHIFNIESWNRNRIKYVTRHIPASENKTFFPDTTATDIYLNLSDAIESTKDIEISDATKRKIKEIFAMRWCFRPIEITNELAESMDPCVWGFADVEL